MCIMRDETKLPPSNPQILLTGASGGLGGALALYHARQGANLSLWGRSAERLAATCAAVEACGAKAETTCHDLADVKGAIERMLDQDHAAPFDRAYLVAGVGDVRPDGAVVEPADQVLRVAEVNFAVPAAMAAALAERMAKRGGGRIVLIGSAAAHHSLPFAASYAGSKAGLARFADALRIAMQPHGVSVTLAAPGFIATPAARAHSANRPFEMPVNEAARRIAMAADRRAPRLVNPWPFALLRVFDALLPGPLRDRLLGGLSP